MRQLSVIVHYNPTLNVGLMLGCVGYEIKKPLMIGAYWFK